MIFLCICRSCQYVLRHYYMKSCKEAYGSPSALSVAYGHRGVPDASPARREGKLPSVLAAIRPKTINVDCGGLLLLYRPKDISDECTFSQHLRYDISFGMGMSDTITLVFRTLTEVDYQCLVEIVTDPTAHMVIVIKFPTTLEINCRSNKDTFTVLKKNKCLRLCDLIADRDQLSPYFVSAVVGKIRFWFLSNSSINSDLDAYMYQVTATAARMKPSTGCTPANETLCTVNSEDFCQTTGIVCDGIDNCGVPDWFDERKSDCGLSVEKLGIAPVVAVVAAIFCALLAAGHTLLRCLPPLANSFFIFNANEDNRLCINPVRKPPGHRAPSIEKAKRLSLIPVSLTSSSNSSEENEEQNIAQTLRFLSITGENTNTPNMQETPAEEQAMPPPRKAAARMRSVAERLHSKFWKEKIRPTFDTI